MQKSVPNAVRSTMYAAEFAEPLSVLRELFELLQDYAPQWYTEDLHIRTASVLGELVLEPVS